MAQDKKQEIAKDDKFRHGNISLVLDSYDDIFSDFDPRKYSEKALSNDFLSECKRAAIDKDEGFELILFVPKKKRNLQEEVVIENRMKAHFHRHFRNELQHITKMRREGGIWIFAGSVMILLATSLYEREELFSRFLFILLEPGGWFTIWNGFENIFLDPRDKVPDFEFYKKMAEVQITFKDY